MDPWIMLLLSALGSWRLTTLIAYESGPFRAIEGLRGLLVRARLGRLVDCFHCLGLWVAGVVVLIVYGFEFETVLMWLAVAGATSIVERWLGGASPGGADGL